MTKIGFIGLGVMGFPMAGHLQTNGHEVTVYNRTTAKATRWAEQYGGQSAPSPREAAEGAEIVITIVGDDPDVETVVLGDDGVLAGMTPGTVLVDHTTASADLARRLHQHCAGQGVGFVDAPVSGGQSGAENGALTVMCGGEDHHFEQVKGVLDHYAVAVTLLGGPGSGQLTKMVNQICIAGLLQGLSEGVHFAKLAGLDVDAVADVISKGAAGSWQMVNRASTMGRGEFDFGFAVDWMRKDLRIALAEGNRVGASLGTTAQVDQYYSRIQARGGKRWDTSSLIDLLDNP